jgi:ectoine hydroxylase-related dioxygenase (phytanoyl-CoA dioxygenase family)
MLSDQGFELRPQAVPGEIISALRGEADRLALLEPEAAHGVRDLLRKSSLIRAQASQAWLRPLLPEGHVCVRGILFDKNPAANWLVAWHQDLTICVQQRHEVQGYGPWSMKHGVPHVQPPVTLLEHMVTLRLHLDDADESNGALQVISGTHRHGKLQTNEIEVIRTREPVICCKAKAGDILIMRPLLLHASSKATKPAHRRIVHLEFAPHDALAAGLAWYENAL